MENNYFNLSGGINQSLTKTALGCDVKKVCWSDSFNVELYQNVGIIKQKGNTVLIQLAETETIIAMREMEADGLYKLVIVTDSGKIYIYDDNSEALVLLDKTLTGKEVIFAPFLRGMLVATEKDAMFYIKNDEDYSILSCNLKDGQAQDIIPENITVYKGRVWCSKGSTIYYSALGTYNDFSSSGDAGYINDFHTDTADIICMHTYKDYLTIYKRERVYLLSGSSPDDFAIIPFADKGAYSKYSVVNVDNRQYFLSNGIFALEQVGELNQIRLGNEISAAISQEFASFDNTRISKTKVVHYQDKHQMWFLFPYANDEYFHTIWINDYVNHAWYKRCLPQNITCCTAFKNYIITAGDNGKIYREDFGADFDGKAIDFMWKSPFLAFNSPHHRKMIDEFYFILDDNYDNKFRFSVYRDYDGQAQDDKELIFSRHFNQLVWAKDTLGDDPACNWCGVDEQVPVWTTGTDVMEKAEICGSCYCVQLCVEGSDFDDNCAIIGLQFREIYNDD